MTIALTSNASGGVIEVNETAALAVDAQKVSATGVFYENGKTVSADYTIAANKNAMSAGPITIAANVTVTVSDGAEWTIV